MDTAQEKDRLLNGGSEERKLLRKTFIYCAIASLIACQLSFMCGTAQGYSAILLPQLTNNDRDSNSLDVNKYEASWIASLGTVCRPVGALVEGYTVERYGRKITMMLAALAFTLSWTLTALSQNIIMIYISRILISIAMGMVICVGLYIAEICLPKQRGTLLSFITPITMLGTLSVYLLGSLLSWNCVGWIFVAHSLVMLITFYFIPESYIWYMVKGQKDDAVYSLLWLRNGDISQASLEIAEAEVLIAQRRNVSYFGTYCDRAVWKPFFILICFSAIQQQAGYTIIIYYAVNFFSSLNSAFDSYLLSIIFAGVSTAGSLMLTFVIHMYNRKTLLAISGIGMSFTMAVAALFVSYDPLKSYHLVPVISIFSYIFFCMLGMIDIPWMIVGEIFPSRVRGSMSAYVTVVIFCITSGVVKMYPILMDFLGKSGMLWYFSVFSLLAVVYEEIFFPETRNKSLFEIEDNLRNKE